MALHTGNTVSAGVRCGTDGNHGAMFQINLMHAYPQDLRSVFRQKAGGWFAASLLVIVVMVYGTM
jgi:hypothetical protein